ncbi:hypothetical protein JCM8097_005101 [Rhodosporidiobolus ruineniae]
MLRVPPSLPQLARASRSASIKARLPRIPVHSLSDPLSAADTAASYNNSGMVRMPDMGAIEAVRVEAVSVPLLPDLFSSTRSTPSTAANADSHFFLRAPAVETVSSRATHIEGGPSSTGGAAK